MNLNNMLDKLQAGVGLGDGERFCEEIQMINERGREFVGYEIASEKYVKFNLFLDKLKKSKTL